MAAKNIALQSHYILLYIYIFQSFGHHPLPKSSILQVYFIKYTLSSMYTNISVLVVYL